jgi:hypothetical protein
MNTGMSQLLQSYQLSTSGRKLKSLQNQVSERTKKVKSGQQSAMECMLLEWDNSLLQTRDAG